MVMLIFDGECGFCTGCANWLTRHTENRAAVVPSQRIDPAAYGLTVEQVHAAAWWIDDSGDRHRGHRAIGEALAACGGGWYILGRLCLVAPFSWGAAIIYHLVARFRHRLPGGTPACRIP